MKIRVHVQLNVLFVQTFYHTSADCISLEKFFVVEFSHKREKNAFYELLRSLSKITKN